LALTRTRIQVLVNLCRWWIRQFRDWWDWQWMCWTWWVSTYDTFLQTYKSRFTTIFFCKCIFVCKADPCVI